MSNGPKVKKLMQVTEEAAPPVHVPLLLGNECYCVTQQDVRRIEDTRTLTYSKVRNGRLVPLESEVPDSIVDAILKQCMAGQATGQSSGFGGHAPCHESSIGIGTSNNTDNLLRHLWERNQAEPMDTTPCNMATGTTTQPFLQQSQNNIASIHQQLQWAAAANNTSAPFPLSYTAATSTTELEPRPYRVRFAEDNPQASPKSLLHPRAHGIAYLPLLATRKVDAGTCTSLPYRLVDGSTSMTLATCPHKDQGTTMECTRGCNTDVELADRKTSTTSHNKYNWRKCTRAANTEENEYY